MSKSQFGQDRIEPLCRLGEPAACPLRPGKIGECFGADGERRSGHRPRPELGAKLHGERRRREGKTEPHPGEPEKLAE